MRKNTSNGVARTTKTPTLIKPQDCASPDQWKAHWAQKNAERIATLARETKTEPEFMMRDLIAIAEPVVQNWIKANAVVSTIKAVLCIHNCKNCPGGWQKVLGFRGGRLCYFDGTNLRSITLKESARIYADLSLEYAENDELEMDYDSQAACRWHEMVAAGIC